MLSNSSHQQPIHHDNSIFLQPLLSMLEMTIINFNAELPVNQQSNLSDPDDLSPPVLPLVCI